MRTTAVIAAIIALASSSEAASLRQRKLADAAYTAVVSVMIPTYSGACSIAQDDESPTVSCSMPASTATLTASGISDQSPQQLAVCTLTTGGNKSCQTYNFNGSMSTAAIIAEAFPHAVHVPTDYDTVVYKMLTYFNGECDITLSHGNTDVSCSDMGGNAKFTASGVSDQSPVQLMVCTMTSGGNTSCNTYNFNGSSSVLAILQEAFA